MDNDPFLELLGLEDEFYEEGFDAGIADSTYAGIVEGRVFGIEKGYEKAFELARMHGRAQVWKARILPQNTMTETSDTSQRVLSNFKKDNDAAASESLHQMKFRLGNLPTNSRMQKHIEALLATTDAESISPDNSDESVTEFDDRLIKARAKAKIIANIVGESIEPGGVANSGIEDATGLNARQ